MAKLSIRPGIVIDGFTVGGSASIAAAMATLWSVTWPDIDVPMLMKIPLVSEGEDPAAIVSFRDGADDPAAVCRDLTCRLVSALAIFARAGPMS